MGPWGHKIYNSGTGFNVLWNHILAFNDKLSLSDLCSRGNKMRSAVLIDNSFEIITFYSVV